MAFIAPGVFAILVGLAYALLRRREIAADHGKPKAVTPAGAAIGGRPSFGSVLLRVSVIVFVTTAISSIVFQSTTFALPKIFAERLQDVGASLESGLGALGLPGRVDLATVIGSLAFVVFAVASMAQLVVGSLLDRFGPRPVFMAAAAVQVVFFAAMPAVRTGPRWPLRSASCSARSARSRSTTT